MSLISRSRSRSVHRAAFQNDLMLLFALPSLPRSALKVAVSRSRASENAAAAVEESAGAQRLEETLSGDQRERTGKKPF